MLFGFHALLQRGYPKFPGSLNNVLDQLCRVRMGIIGPQKLQIQLQYVEFVAHKMVQRRISATEIIYPNFIARIAEPFHLILEMS